MAVSEYDTRVSGRRFIAHWVDGLLITILLVGAVLLVGMLPEGTLGDIALGATFVLGLTVGQLSYYVLSQRRNGRTPGKWLVRIRVVDAAGRTPTTRQLVKRTVPLIVEYFYVIAFIGMMASPYRQRFGDRWADTYVVD